MTNKSVTEKLWMMTFPSRNCERLLYNALTELRDGVHRSVSKSIGWALGEATQNTAVYDTFEHPKLGSFLKEINDQ